MFWGRAGASGECSRMPLSDAKIRSLRSQERDFKVGDFDGLYLLVKKTGSRSWRFKYGAHGKEELAIAVLQL